MSEVFTFKRFRTEDIAVRCRTKRKYMQFMRLCEKEEFEWCDGHRPTYQQRNYS